MSDRHIQSLIHRRVQVQRAIEAERASANPESLRLAQLKKVRLLLKDRLARLSAHAATVIDGPRQANVGERRRRLRARSRKS